jgi:hypothetical protein
MPWGSGRCAYHSPQAAAVRRGNRDHEPQVATSLQHALPVARQVLGAVPPSTTNATSTRSSVSTRSLHPAARPARREKVITARAAIVTGGRRKIPWTRVERPEQPGADQRAGQRRNGGDLPRHADEDRARAHAGDRPADAEQQPRPPCRGSSASIHLSDLRGRGWMPNHVARRRQQHARAMMPHIETAEQEHALNEPG